MKANKAKNNAGKDRTAVNQAANAIRPAQQECPTYLNAAQEALEALQADHA